MLGAPTQALLHGEHSVMRSLRELARGAAVLYADDGTALAQPWRTDPVILARTRAPEAGPRAGRQATGRSWRGHTSGV